MVWLGIFCGFSGFHFFFCFINIFSLFTLFNLCDVHLWSGSPDDWECFLHYLGCLLEDDQSWCNGPSSEPSCPPKSVVKPSHVTDDVVSDLLFNAPIYAILWMHNPTIRLSGALRRSFKMSLFFCAVQEYSMYQHRAPCSSTLVVAVSKPCISYNLVICKLISLTCIFSWFLNAVLLSYRRCGPFCAEVRNGSQNWS